MLQGPGRVECSTAVGRVVDSLTDLVVILVARLDRHCSLSAPDAADPTLVRTRVEATIAAATTDDHKAQSEGCSGDAAPLPLRCGGRRALEEAARRAPGA